MEPTDRTDDRCPHCGSPWLVARSTRAEGQIVDLVARCRCGGRVEASGIGEEQAVTVFAARVAKRVGTAPEDWRIPIRPAGPRSVTRRRFR